jgi:hypothetical protein
MFHSIFVSFSIGCFKCIICIHILYISKVTLHLSTYTCKVNKRYMIKIFTNTLTLRNGKMSFSLTLYLHLVWNFVETYIVLLSWYTFFGKTLHLSLLGFNISKSNIHVWHWCKYKISKMINWVNLYIGFKIKSPNQCKTCKSVLNVSSFILSCR